jgi:hypothetical protein
MSRLPVYYVDRDIFANDYQLLVTDGARGRVSAANKGVDGVAGVVVELSEKFDLFGKDMEIVVAMFSNILDNKPIEFKLSPINVKGSGVYRHLTAALEMFPTAASLQTMISVNEDTFGFETSVKACAKVSVSGTGSVCLAGRCVDLPSEPAALLLPKEFVCQNLVRRLQTTEDLWKLETELYRALQVNMTIPISKYTDMFDPIVYSCISVGAVLLAVSACAASVAIYLTKKKLDRRRARSERQAAQGEDTSTAKALSFHAVEQSLQEFQ